MYTKHWQRRIARFRKRWPLYKGSDDAVYSDIQQSDDITQTILVAMAVGWATGCVLTGLLLYSLGFRLVHF